MIVHEDKNKVVIVVNLLVNAKDIPTFCQVNTLYTAVLAMIIPSHEQLDS